MIRVITVQDCSETLMFAASELARYLRLISLAPVAVEVVCTRVPTQCGIALRIDDTLDAETDAIAIGVVRGAGTITGGNTRSVLLGVYRFLYHVGCRWVRPGADGEFLPRVNLDVITIQCHEQAAHRHRTICLEGAVSLEHVLAMVDWAPKVGFSGYFIQFPDGFNFFDHWYAHHGAPLGQREPFSQETARAWTITIEQEIQKRGLVYHAVGHGWTCRTLGIEASHWDPYYQPLAAEDRAMIAELQGQRAFLWDRPMLTSLCFGNPTVRQRMVDTVTQYALQHPEVDLLHVWLDDGGENKCECPLCREHLPSDLYVLLLHELDQALSAMGSTQRIVFLGYSDLLWPPVEQSVVLNPARFVFMYANSRGAFTETLADASTVAQIPTYQRNRNQLARTANEFQGFLRGWQQFFTGDSFLFEYYGMDSVKMVLNPFALAEVIHSDIQHLPALGLQGLVSCQLQRACFPTGLPTYLLGQTLWDDQQALDDVRNDYFFAAYGADCGLCKEFIKVAGEEIVKAVRFNGILQTIPTCEIHFLKLEGIIRDFTRVVERNLHLENPCHARSWYYLHWYLHLLTGLLVLFRLIAAGSDEVYGEWQRLRADLIAHESCYHAVFDLWSFLAVFHAYLINGQYSTAPEKVIQ